MFYPGVSENDAGSDRVTKGSLGNGEKKQSCLNIVILKLLLLWQTFFFLFIFV